MRNERLDLEECGLRREAPVAPEEAAELPPNERSHLLEVLRLLRRRRRFILQVGAMGLILATVTAWLLPRRYDCTALLAPTAPEDPRISALLQGGAGSLLASTVMGGSLSTPNAYYMALLRGRTLRDHLIDRFELRKRYATPYYSLARQKLDEQTSVSEDKQSGIVAITIRDRDPALAAAMANAHVEELNRILISMDTSAAHRERVFLEEQLKNVKQDLDNAMQQLGEFSSKTGAIDIEAQSRAMLDAGARLQGDVIAAQSELQGLGQIYSESNSRIRSARARLAELRRQLSQLGSADGAGQGNTIYPSVRQLPLLQGKYFDLYRRTKIEEAVFDTLAQRNELARVEEARTLPTARLLEAASVPEMKSFPPRQSIVVLGTLFSFAVAVGWLLVAAYWQRLDARDVRKRVVVEALALVR